MDHYGPLINPVNSHELVAVAECDSGARKQRLGGIVTISRSSTFTRPPGHGDGKTVDPEDPCHCGARYIAVNQRMRSLDKRWTCPVCGSALRPDDVVLHPFAQGILDTLRGDEDSVEAIVFDEDCNWSTISAVKDEKRGAEGEGEEGGGARAEMIDLSDSE